MTGDIFCMIKYAAIFLMLFFSTASIAAAELTDQELNAALDEAGELFHQANSLSQADPDKAKELYQQSILRYRKVIEQGNVKNSDLYYNIANGYLLKGEVGRAILNYRRAQQFNDADPELIGNLAYARSLCIDQIPIKTQEKVMQTLFFWHYDFSLKSRFIVAAIFWSITCLIITLKILVKRKSNPAILLAMVCLLITLAFVGSVIYETSRQTAAVQGVITADSTIARQGDGLNYPESFKEPLHSGTEFDLLEKRNNWLKIQLNNGDSAWISASEAETIN